MVEITITCDVCGDTLFSVDVSDRLCVEEVSEWPDCLFARPSYVLALNAPKMLLGIRDWASFGYDGKERLMCESCVMELNDRLFQSREDMEGILRDFFGDNANDLTKSDE